MIQATRRSPTVYYRHGSYGLEQGEMRGEGRKAGPESGPDDVEGAFSAPVGADLEHNRIALAEGVPEAGFLDGALVEEYVLTLLGRYESESLRLIEELHCSIHTHPPVEIDQNEKPQRSRRGFLQ